MKTLGRTNLERWKLCCYFLSAVLVVERVIKHGTNWIYFTYGKSNSNVFAQIYQDKKA